MPSLIRKTSRHCRRTSSTKEKPRKEDVCVDPRPMPFIHLCPQEAVSPLKEPRMAPSTSSWSDDELDYLTQIQERNPNLIIPPRPSHSQWQPDDFFRTVWAWNLNQDEIHHLRELEANLSDITHWKNCPQEVVRFLKGPLGYKATERLFRRMIEWRIQENVDTILQDYTPPPILLEYIPTAMLKGLDHDGDPIYLERAGATDVASLLKRFGNHGLARHLIWLREVCGRGDWIQDHEERMGRPITEVTIVYDLAGLNARHLRHGVLPFFGQMMRISQEYYTRPVKRVIIIRAPAIFRYVWATIKHFFDPSEVAKMTFTGPNNHEEVLSQFMDLSVLPPCISPLHGRGYAADGWPRRFEGGILPADFEPKTTTKHAVLRAEPSSTTLTDMWDDNSNITPVSASTLGSGFFQMDDSGEIYVSPVRCK